MDDKTAMTVARFMEAYVDNEKKRKIINYARLNEGITPGQILFAGSSLMEHFPIVELCTNDPDMNGKIVYNRGLAGATTDEFLTAIDALCLDVKPSKLFINIGTNDMNDRDDDENWLEHLTGNYNRIMDLICQFLPDCRIYMMAYYPVNEHMLAEIPSPMGDKFRTRSQARVIEANQAVREIAAAHGVEYIDVNDGLTDADGQLQCEFSVEGVHMYADAYRVIYQNLKQYL